MITPERWRRVDELFHSALGRDGAERAAFLREACAGDDSLRREVERLIAAHEKEGSFIDSPAYADTALLIDNQAALTAGQRLGPYKVMSHIGSGGMGEVYLAEDTRLGRKVALKLLPAAFTANEDRLRRFRQEAKTASALNHPNIITIYEIGESGSINFTATEFIDGETLRERMREAPMKLGDALDVAIQTASALAAAHAAGIIHRDIKPENIMIRRDGIIKVLDFGLAKLIERTPPEAVDTEAATRAAINTEPGVVLGTAQYMSPEQARGLSVDARTDIWSLGCVLYEMMTGRQPFVGATMLDVLSAILNQEPELLVQHILEAPRKLEHIINRALRKDPGQRYQTVKDVLIDLKDLKNLEMQTQLESSTPPELRARPSTAYGSEAAPQGCERRLIVLPFRMLRPDAETDFLTFSLPDAITSSLSGFDSLVLRSSLTASRFANAAPDFRVIAAEAVVNTVLTGTLLRAGDQLRLSAQLVEAPSGTVIWSHTAQVNLRDIFQVQDELVNRIVDSLSVPLTSREREMVKRDVPTNPVAYEFYLRANQLAQDVRQISAARALYERSVELDRQYAPAWARLGRCYWWQAKWSSRADEDLALAEQAFQRAFALNPDLPLAHNLYARFEADRGRAILAFRRLLQRVKVSRSDAELYVGLVQACRYAGLLQASAAAHSHALRLDPQARTSVEYTYFMMGDYTQVLSAPKADFGYVKACTLMLVRRDPEASELIRESLKVAEGESLYSGGFKILRGIIEGNRSKSLDLMETRRHGKFIDLEHCYHLSRQLSYLGETRRALETLSQITERGFCCYPALTIDPWFEPLRRTEEFQTVMEQAKALHEKARRAFIEAGGEQALNIAAG